MADLTAQRTLVKSPPELWSEVSEVETLAKHLGELGEIEITKVEPETTVAWEGEQISGTVELEQSGWGTKVTFSATVPEPDPPPEPEPAAESEPEPEPAAIVTPPTEVEPEPEPEPKPLAETKPLGFWARLFGRQPTAEPVSEPEVPTVEFPAVVVEPEPVEPEPEPEPEAGPVEPDPEPLPAALAPERVQAILDGTLEALGQAHHRPFSRG